MSVEDFAGWVVVLFIMSLPILFFLWVIWIVIQGFVEQMPSRRRKRRSRYCHYGYDLTGNVSGTCPECGAWIPWRKSAHLNNELEPRQKRQTSTH